MRALKTKSLRIGFARTAMSPHTLGCIVGWRKYTTRSSAAPCEEHMRAPVSVDGLDSDHSDALGDADRRLVLGVDHRHDPRHLEVLQTGAQARPGGLGCIPAA